MNREDVAMDVTVQNVEILRGRLEQVELALAGMLFAFDDGVGQEWSAPVLDFARQLVKAKEFDASQQGEPCEHSENIRSDGVCIECGEKVRDKHPEQAEGCDEHSVISAPGCKICLMQDRDRWKAKAEDLEQRLPCACPGIFCVREQAEGAQGELDERMRAAGMYTVAEMLKGTPLDTFTKHAGVCDLDTFGQWLEMKRAEYLKMQARYDLGERDKSDDLYEWVIAHLAVFTEAHVNFRAALAQPSPCKSQVAEALRVADWSNTCIGNKALILAAIEQLEAHPSPASELERPEVVAWALQRKRDGFVRATWHQKPSETQYEIAELDGDVIAPLYAAPSVSTWKAPEGFALVPIEPTVAMRMPWKTMRGYSWHSKYKAMLAAAAVQRGEL